MRLVNKRIALCFVYICLIQGAGALVSCKKAVEIAPPATAITSETVYENNATAAAVLTSIYDRMSNQGLSDGGSSLSCELGLAADELINYNPSFNPYPKFYGNSLSSADNYFWAEIWQEVYVCNAALEGLSTSTGLTESLKQQLQGEAKFIRAFLLFYATNLFGDIPLVTTTNYSINNVIKRSPKTQVYGQIISDLKDAQALLSDNFLTPVGLNTTERVRPNRGAATALLARVYLYLGDWSNAEAQATNVINSSMYSLVTSLSQVFQKNSPEAIWQLQPVLQGYNTAIARLFDLTSPPGSSVFPVALNSNFPALFETGDQRYPNWVGHFSSGNQTYLFSYKYKVYLQNQTVSEYFMVLRLAEQYLIRAEARAEQNNISGAQMDLNVIRVRGGLGNTIASSRSDLLAAIMHERRVELFTEWGHRWFDLIRTGSVDSVMSVVTPQKGGVWNQDWKLLPIPQSEILLNPNLTQNPGYN